MHENHEIAHKNAQKSFIHFKPSIGNVAITGTKNIYMCLYVQLAVLGSKGIVVKCTATIFFRTADYTTLTTATTDHLLHLMTSVPKGPTWH